MSDPAMTKEQSFKVNTAVMMMAGAALAIAGIVLEANLNIETIPFANGLVTGAGIVILVLGLERAARIYGTDNPVEHSEEGS